jgi:hypothetical protein
MGRSILVSRTAFVVIALPLIAGFGLPHDHDTPRAPDFVITVTSTLRSFELACERGCTWTTLRFSTSPDSAPEVIDQFGLIAKTPIPNSVQPRPVSFLFAVQRTTSAVKLQGLLGTAWAALTYSCNQNGCTQTIDERGMR